MSLYSRNSVPFIRIINDKLTLQTNPQTYFNRTNVPVISCIGTSRDGKSTFLNFLINYILRHRLNRNIDPFEPFYSAPSDEPVTVGIDMYKPSDDIDYIYFDCQGMQLTDAKYDAHLGLLTYNISDVIILNIRRVLDLQVFNNLLPMFIFLIDIPEEYQRVDKPVLIIRIMDYNNRKVVNDEKYLNNLIDTWLTPNGDQYDKIKEAFRTNFSKIVCVPTLVPKFSNLVLDSDGYPIEDYTHPEFVTGNRTWKNSLHKIYNEIKDTKYVSKLNNLETCIQELNDNENIDYKKLDFYGLYIKSELSDYHKNFIVDNILFDTKLIEEMDGSVDAYNKYTSRYNDIAFLVTQIYKQKFKNIPIHLVDDYFKKDIDNMFNIVTNLRIKNMNKAELLIKSHWNRYNKKFLNLTIPKLTNKFIDIYEESKTTFINNVINIDINTVSNYINLIDIEKEILLTIKSEIDTKNNDISSFINKKIDKYLINIDEFIIHKLSNFINSIDNNNKNYNIKMIDILFPITKKIYNTAINIFKQNIVIYHLNPKYKTETKILVHKPKHSIDRGYFIDRCVRDSKLLQKQQINSPFNFITDGKIKKIISYTPELKNIFNNMIDAKLSSIGFLSTVRYIQDIKYVDITVNDHKYIMTNDFYNKYYKLSIQSITNKLPYINITTEEKTNVKYITVSPPDNIHSNSPKLTTINNMIKEAFVNESLLLAVKLGIELY